MYLVKPLGYHDSKKAFNGVIGLGMVLPILETPILLYASGLGVPYKRHSMSEDLAHGDVKDEGYSNGSRACRDDVAWTFWCNVGNLRFCVCGWLTA